MTAEKAIRILDPVSTAEAITEIEYYSGFNGKNAAAAAWDEACRIAVAALRAQQEAEKNEPCDFRIHDNTLCCYGPVFGWEGRRINFCPVCGRKLSPLKN